VHSDLIKMLLCDVFVVLVLFGKNTPHIQRQVGTVGYAEMHAQNQTQNSTRLKAKQDDFRIKEEGGKRWKYI